VDDAEVWMYTWLCVCVSQSCLKRSFKASVYSCPTCRSNLADSCQLVVNDGLQSALSKLFPGYELARWTD